MEDENGREGNMKTESEEEEGCGQVPWCGLLSLSELLSAGRRWLGSGVFNLTLYSTIWEFIATSTRDCSGIKWLICLCYPRRIRGEHNFLVCQEIFLWVALFTSLTDYQLAPAHCSITAQQTLISIFLTPMSSLIIIHWLARLQFFRTVLCSSFVLLLMHRNGLNSFQVHELYSI